MDEELRNKLAMWAGFRQLPKANRAFHYEGGERVMNWMPLGAIEWWQSQDFLPNFTESLDACFEWLVPKAIDKIMAKQECSSDLAYAILFKKWLQELELDIPQHAPTLCKAIEQLIDKGE